MRAMPGAALPPPVQAALRAPQPGERVSIEAAGIPFSALTWGQATARPLLLVHGVTASAAVWWRIGPALAATGRRVVAPDLPGHGLTGHWLGHHGYRENAADLASFARAAGLAGPDLQVVGHSWGAMTTAALPVAGLRPRTLVLLDPPAIPTEVLAALVNDSSERTYDDLAEAERALAAANPAWSPGDVAAKAEALTQLDEAAARAVLLDNDRWDGGLGDLADPAAAGIDVWLVRGDPTTGGLVQDWAAHAFEARYGVDHVITVPGAPHSPQRTHPDATTAALLWALGER